MHETTTALTELRISLQCTQTQVEELKVKQSKENINDLSKKMLDFKDTTKKMEQSIDYQENQSRRCNLRFGSISEVDSARHQHQARAPNWQHGDESQDNCRQVQIVQGPRAGATGGEEESSSGHLCERRLLTDGHGEVERTVDEGPGRGGNRVFDV